MSNEQGQILGDLDEIEKLYNPDEYLNELKLRIEARNEIYSV